MAHLSNSRCANAMLSISSVSIQIHVVSKYNLQVGYLWSDLSDTYTIYYYLYLPKYSAMLMASSDFGQGLQAPTRRTTTPEVEGKDAY
jgi:hypothetical protein